MIEGKLYRVTEDSLYGKDMVFYKHKKSLVGDPWTPVSDGSIFMYIGLNFRSEVYPDGTRDIVTSYYPLVLCGDELWFLSCIKDIGVERVL